MPFNPADISRVVKHMDGLAKEFDGRAMAEDMAKLGKIVAKEVDAAVRSTPARKGTLSDGSMSGWRRGSPMVISGRSFKVTGGGVSIAITPGKASGPMRVLEDGRAAHGVGEGLLRYRQTKTKGLRVSHRVVGKKSGRGVGATEGKGTWTKAEAAMSRSVARGMPVLIAKKIKRVAGLL